MTFNEYQKLAHSTALPSSQNLQYLIMGLVGEVGELCSGLAKRIRDKTEPDDAQIKKECGDVLWFLSEYANWRGFSLDEIARMNIAKLQSRQQRGVLGGSGDNR